MIKSIISVNKKFMDIAPKRLIEIINKTKSTSGIELFINCKDQLEMNYLEELVHEIRKTNLILQIHCDIENSLEDQIVYLKKLENYSQYLNQKIVITFHPIYDKDKDISILKTKEYMNKIIEEINSNNLILCLENLNNLDGIYRLKKEDLYSVLIPDEKIFLTYDIGHELVELETINYPNNELLEEIRNVHIHDYNKGVEHYPIYKSSSNLDIILKSIKSLINDDYQYSIVYEYDLFECNGDTIEEKVIDYLKSIEFVTKFYNV